MRLVGAVTRRGAAVQLRGAIFVEAHGEFGAGARFESGQRGQRHHFAGRVAHIELADVLGFRAVLVLGLDVDLPLAAEAVEVVDEQPAHEGLDGPVNVVDRHPCLITLSRSTSTNCCGTLGRKVVVRVPISGRLRAAAMNLFRLSDKKLDVLAGPVFQDERESAGSADAGNGGRREAEGHSFRKLAQLPIQVRLDGLELLGSGLAIVPVLHGDEEECVVAGSHEAEQAEAQNAGGVLDAGRLRQNILDFRRHLLGSLQRGGVGKLDVQVKIALILVGNEAGGQFVADEIARHAEASQQNQRHHAFSDEHARQPDVAVPWRVRTCG